MYLKWNTYIEALFMKLYSCTYVIRLKEICLTPAARTAYSLLFETYLRYSIMVWDGTTNTNIERVFLQQKKGMRSLSGLGHRASYRQSFQQHKVLTVPAMYIADPTNGTIKQTKTWRLYLTTTPEIPQTSHFPHTTSVSLRRCRPTKELTTTTNCLAISNKQQEENNSNSTAAMALISPILIRNRILEL